MKYFETCKTKEKAKRTFRKLVKKLHPDCGGKAEEFVAMMSEYKFVLRWLKCSSADQRDSRAYGSQSQSEHKSEESGTKSSRKQSKKKKVVYRDTTIMDMINKSIVAGGKCSSYDKDTFVLSRKGYKTAVIKLFKVKPDGTHLYSMRQYNVTPKKYAACMV